MKKLWIIPFIAVLSFFLSSCERENVTGSNRGEWDIFRGYIQFSTDVSTRSQLATNMRGKNFGVFGYQYNTTTTWGAAKSTATPGVFYNQKVICDVNGTCTYDTNNNEDGNQYKTWEEKHYSFFAYHPYGGAGISLSDQTAVNTPKLTYTYDWYGDAQRIDVTNSKNIFDLMTAEAIDEDGSSSVAFDFKHRLFAVEILANNYNENVYEYDEEPVYEVDDDGNVILDGEGNKIQATDKEGNLVYKKVIRKDAEGNNIIADGGDARQVLGMLTVKIEGLKYNSMTIPMSTSSGEATPAYSGPETAFAQEFIISTNDVTVPAYNETVIDKYGERGGGVPTSISKLGSEGGGYVMLIPQTYTADKPLKFSLNWLNKPANSDQVKTDFESTIDFEPGRLYQVIINFVGSGITIALIEAGAWDSLTVEHTFE